MRYCDYEYYNNEFAGSLPEAQFNRLSIIATAKIKANTFNRIHDENITTDVKNCTCALVDELARLEKQKGKTSETVSGWSISYDNAEQDEILVATMKEFISEFMYRGGGQNV